MRKWNEETLHRERSINGHKIDEKLFNMSGYYTNANEDTVKIPSYSRTNDSYQ